LSIGITFLSSFTVAQTLEISTSETSYKCDEEIVVDVRLGLGNECYTIAPLMVASHFTFIVADGEGEAVEPSDVIFELETPPCNFATFCSVEAIEWRVFLNRSGAEDLYGPYFTLPEGEYSLTLHYDVGMTLVVFETDPEDDYCHDKVFRKDVVRRLKSNTVYFTVEPIYRGVEVGDGQRQLTDAGRLPFPNSRRWNR